MKPVLLFAMFCGLTAYSTAQIHLTNPSFEGEPQDATVPVGWLPCEKGTTPDILPGPWGVFLEASEGETFVGLITREDGSFESIAQRLREPLQPKDCYTFKIDLAHSNTYASYSQPLRLRVWGGQTRCGKDQLLAETKFITHSDWENYEFQFSPKLRLNYLLIEAHYKDGYFSYKGNILLDNMTAIKKCVRASL